MANNNSKQVEQYTHDDKKRLNNPPVGLVNPENDKDEGKKQYQYDPHLDPQLVWAGKAERTSFEVPTVSLHVHERIDPRTIIEKFVKKPTTEQPGLFDVQEAPLREEIEFYQHEKGWTNRLIAGDSLLVMNSLLEKEGMAGKVQMVYIDPPYGISYGSNFQPFVDNKKVQDKDDDLTSEPETIRAFRDTWELGIHSYLTNLRDRIYLSKQLLSNTGSIFLQISEANVHHVSEILDEIFGATNFVALIPFRKTNMALGSKLLGRVTDFILWYAVDKENIKYRRIYKTKSILENPSSYSWVEDPDGTRRKVTQADIEKYQSGENVKFFTPIPLTSSGFTESCTYEFEYEGKKFSTSTGKSWVTTKDGMERLISLKRLFIMGNTPFWVQYLDELAVIPYDNVWNDTRGELSKIYAVQTTTEVVKRCILMTTDPGDLILDITCGSGTTANVSEHWGRRWITCDTSRVAVTLTKARMMTSYFDYYEPVDDRLGVSSGFTYKKVQKVTLKALANNEPPSEIELVDQPNTNSKKLRVSGPFTLEAVPAPVTKSFDDIEYEETADASVSREGETLRQAEWRDELLKTGVRMKGGQYIKFSRVEPLQGTRYIQAEAETIGQDGQDSKRVLVVFGPEHAPMEQKLVSLALDEAETLRPKPNMLLFVAFQFDPEAAKDIDETNWPGIDLLKVQMNADLFTDDLKKKRSSNDSFWLVGQPDVVVRQKDGKYVVEVKGFDYYNTKTGTVESGSQKNIAMWMLDEDYDGRSLYPAQVFFPMAGKSDGWDKLAKNLKAEIDEELIEQFRGTESIPFEAGEYKRAAVKIIDDRGIESLRIISLE